MENMEFTEVCMPYKVARNIMHGNGIAVHILRWFDDHDVLTVEDFKYISGINTDEDLRSMTEAAWDCDSKVEWVKED